jgi:hypothetical protein
VEIGYEDQMALLEGVVIEIENGQPKAGTEAIVLPPSIIEIFAYSNEETPIWKYALYVVPLLVLLVLIAVLLLYRKRRRAAEGNIRYVEVGLPRASRDPDDRRF